MCALERLYSAHAYRKIKSQLQDSVSRLRRGDSPAKVVGSFTMETRALVVDTLNTSLSNLERRDVDQIIAGLEECIEEVEERINNQ